MSQLICKNLLVGYEGKAILDPLNFEIHAGGYLCVKTVQEKVPG